MHANTCVYINTKIYITHTFLRQQAYLRHVLKNLSTLRLKVQECSPLPTPTCSPAVDVPAAERILSPQPVYVSNACNYLLYKPVNFFLIVSMKTNLGRLADNSDWVGFVVICFSVKCRVNETCVNRRED